MQVGYNPIHRNGVAETGSSPIYSPYGTKSPLWHFFKYTHSDYRLAFEFLHKALAIETCGASVHAALGLIYLLGGRLFSPHDRKPWLAAGPEHARIAAELDPIGAKIALSCVDIVAFFVAVHANVA